MNVSCLTPSKLATLMAQGADIIAIQETWKSSEQIASMHTGDHVLYARSRIGKGGGVAVLVRKTFRSKRIPLTIPQHDTSLEVVVVQVALDQNRDLIVASAYMRPPPQVMQSFRRLVNCLPASSPLLLCGDFNMHHPQWEPFLQSSPSEVAAEFLELCTDAGLTLVNIPGEITYARGTRERSCIDLTWSKHLTVPDWSASVSPLSDHYMLTFTLHQAFKDTIPSAPPSAPKIFYSWGKCKWDLFVKDFDAQLPAYDYKKQSTGIKAFTRALITSYRRNCSRGMHKDGPRLWDDTLMEAERIATDSKARYLQLQMPDRGAEMQRTRSQFFLLLRERLRNTYLRRISKLNPAKPLAWKYIYGRERASSPSPTSALMSDGHNNFGTARRAADALNRRFLPSHPFCKVVGFSKVKGRTEREFGCFFPFLLGRRTTTSLLRHLLHFLLLLLALSRRTTTSLPLHLIQFLHSHLIQSHRIKTKLPPHLVYLLIFTPLLMHLLIVRNCLLRYVLCRMARPPDRMKSTVRHCDIFRQRVFDFFFVAVTTAGRQVRSRLSGDALPSSHS
ncbi:putative trans-sialidase [Trypanosoma cruzi]|nr:putative trans-sialidase [Trypanosoma cruzi]